ncbi:maltose ABC transporter substrate-binding protein [Anaerocolumna sp. AGMB13025]|uniref:sugar ABC transporter substrate-binding protein n=1 Tax=Anaerocolumna sp. AGMB13025 TaxID=3039116 RepID=UPI00241E5677|nr:maltose ABC transporter substrate-binding protein [Anaerocolumna sp. AGMB13025]WFR58981.1 maltose ABC transporter substrate-binding protein [Anaerocolumna sp. AGMB13025]
MKKILSILLIITLICSAFSGCAKKEIPFEQEENTVEEAGSQKSEGEASQTSEVTGNETRPVESEDLTPEDGAKLNFWTLSGYLEYGKAVADLFEQKYGVKVEVQENGLDTVNKMMLDGPSGNGADVFMAAHDSFLTAKDAGILAELSADSARTVSEKINETAVKTVTESGKIYGVPVSIETYALLYNKTLVKGEPATTFEQIKEEARSYNNAAENKFWYLTVPTDGYPAYPFLSIYGFQLFGADGTDGDNPGFNTPEFEKGLEAIASLKEIIPIKADDLKIETMSLLEQKFKEGKTAYYPIGPWLVKSLKEENIDFGVTQLPTYDGKPMRSFSAVQNAYVSAYTKYPKAAELLAVFLSSDEAASLLYSKAYKITANKDITGIEGLKDDQELKVFSEEFTKSVPMPSTKRISYYWTIMQSVLSAVFDGKLTPQEGAKKAQDDFEALVASE